MQFAYLLEYQKHVSVERYNHLWSIKKKVLHIGLVDADLLCNGTRHPNLALLKIAGYLKDNGFVRKTDITSNDKVSTYVLLTNDNNFEDLKTLVSR